MRPTFVVFHVPEEGTLVSTFDVGATDAFDPGAPNGARGFFKIVPIVGQAFGTTIVDFDGERVRVKGLKGSVCGRGSGSSHVGKYGGTYEEAD
jgi:hypothetical protein